MDSLSVEFRQSKPIPLAARFACSAGELLALVGPSGSGKSTILRAIAGLSRPQNGTVVCNQTTWLDTKAEIWMSPQQRSVGLVFQNYALFPHMTALENVTAALMHLPGVERRPRAEELLALVRLKGLESRFPAQLSGGQQQRVALARALARDPSVLLLDEPFSAVDQVTRRKLQTELARLRRSVHIPIVLVTHDLDEARMLADRMCIVHRGETLQIGTPEEVMTRPKDAQVARMVNLINVFKAHVVTQSSGSQATVIRWRDRTLTCRSSPAYSPGETVDWVVPQQFVLLHQRVRPSLGERENPVAGVIDELLVLGETASISMLVDERAGETLHFAVPLHVARRNRLAVGESVSVSLLAEGIHLMPHLPGPRDQSEAN